jgi:hypothetical protein
MLETVREFVAGAGARPDADQVAAGELLPALAEQADGHARRNAAVAAAAGRGGQPGHRALAWPMTGR